MNSDKLANQFWLKKVTLPLVLLNNFLKINLLMTFWNY